MRSPRIKRSNDLKPEAKKRALLLLVNTIVLVALYFIVVQRFPYIMFVYLAAGAGLGIFYVVYNRGFSGKNVTPEMLPDTMSLAEKQAFIEDSRRRLKQTDWVLLVLIPILLTFLFEMAYLFLFPMIAGVFS